MLDGSNIRALNVQPVLKKYSDIASEHGLYRPRGGFGTQIPLAIEGSGLPLNIVLSPGQVNRSQFALHLLSGIDVQRQNGSMKRLNDNAYAGPAPRNELKRGGIEQSSPKN